MQWEDVQEVVAGAVVPGFAEGEALGVEGRGGEEHSFGPRGGAACVEHETALLVAGDVVEGRDSAQRRVFFCLFCASTDRSVLQSFSERLLSLFGEFGRGEEHQCLGVLEDIA